MSERNQSAILIPLMNQNNEPYVDVWFGPDVDSVAKDEVLSVIFSRGFGARQGYGPGERKNAEETAEEIAKEMRFLGWNVRVKL